MRSLTLIIVGILIISLTVDAQKVLINDLQNLNNEVDSMKIGYFESNQDNSVHTVNQRIWVANQQFSYLSFLPVIASKRYDPKRDFLDGEGRKGYVMEGHIDQRFTIVMGRNQNNSFWQSMRLTFDVNFLLRMAKDSSNPLLPSNNRFGLGYDLKLWDSYSGKPKRDLKYSFEDWLRRREKLSTINLNLAAMHYSNGQSSRNPAFNNATNRNNYIDGNFSTNYIQAMIYYSRLGYNLSKQRDLFSAGLGYQIDGKVGGPLDYPIEQEKKYGHHRIKGMLMFRKNFDLNSKITWAIQNNKYQGCDCIKERIETSNRHEFTFRTDVELIAGDLSLYPFQNKNRLGTSLAIHYTRWTWRTTGLYLRYYSGRDYLNIRYDDVVRVFQIGATFTLDKYRSPYIGGDIIKKRSDKGLYIRGCEDAGCADKPEFENTRVKKNKLLN